MKGGLELYVAVPLLVIVGIFVIALLGGTYIRSLTVGPPVQVATYTEYRWMNYLPSSAIFALTYSSKGETSTAWQALNTIALYKASGTPMIVKHSDMFTSFSKVEGLLEGKSGDLDALDKRISVIEDSLNEGSSVKREFYFVKDSSGLMLVYGLDRILNQVKDGTSAMISFPEDYPYKCSEKQVPVFSKDQENMRINLAICCQGIKRCQDYLAGAGRGECSADDSCSVGPCRIVQPIEGDRECVENFPPKIGISVIKQTGMDIQLKIDVTEDSAIKQIMVDYGDGATSDIDLEGLTDYSDPSATPPLISTTDSKDQIIGKTAIISHTYEKAGEYTIKCNVWDDANSLGKGEIKVSVKSK